MCNKNINFHKETKTSDKSILCEELLTRKNKTNKCYPGLKISRDENVSTTHEVIKNIILKSIVLTNIQVRYLTRKSH